MLRAHPPPSSLGGRTLLQASDSAEVPDQPRFVSAGPLGTYIHSSAPGMSGDTGTKETVPTLREFCGSCEEGEHSRVNECNQQQT